MIWLYALTDRPHEQLPAIAGHEDRCLDQTRVGELAAVWSACSPSLPVAAGDDGLWRQEAVLEALMEGRTVLPVRYGTVIDEIAALHRMLTERSARWLDALGQVDGCVEMAVRAGSRSATAPSPDVDESGTEYLNRLRSRAADARALTTSVHAPLATIARASESQTSADAPAHLTASYLVSKLDLDRFACTVEDLAADKPELAIVCTGPWPPYSFVQTTDDGL